jgi:SAM-dependent methyltransferase
MPYTDLHRYKLYPQSRISLTWAEQLMVRLKYWWLGRCPICGRVGFMYVEHENLRETCVCTWCGSTNRQRQIAYVICGCLTEARKVRMSSLRDLSKLEAFSVYNTEARGPLHDALSRLERYSCSEYFGPDRASGQTIDNVMHQDLTTLSFDDESIDLVISADVFEHLPRPYKAHQEVYRVLKKSGRHIFTVPFHQTEYFDEDRVIVGRDGGHTFLKDPLYHHDPVHPDKGSLVYTIFSLEMLMKLRMIGFITNMYRLHKPLYGILGPNAIVFESVKPAAPLEPHAAS